MPAQPEGRAGGASAQWCCAHGAAWARRVLGTMNAFVDVTVHPIVLGFRVTYLNGVRGRRRGDVRCAGATMHEARGDDYGADDYY